MAVYRLSRAAQFKLTEIYEYSLLNFGEQRADAYLLSLHESFERLANMPQMGRLWRRWRRHEHAEHVVFYEVSGDGILVVQIFHHREDIAEWMR